MVNSMMSINQCKTHLLKMVQVLLHAVVHPQVYVDLIHNVCSIREYQSGCDSWVGIEGYTKTRCGHSKLRHVEKAEHTGHTDRVQADIRE